MNKEEFEVLMKMMGYIQRGPDPNAIYVQPGEDRPPPYYAWDDSGPEIFERLDDGWRPWHLD